MKADNKSWNEMRLQERLEFLQCVALFPALSLTVYTRTRHGFRVLKPTWLVLLAAIIMGGSSVLSYGHHTSVLSDTMPIVYAVGMLVAGLVKRRRRWAELRNGVQWHTYCSGISHLERLPLPNFLLENRRLYRFVEPVLCFIGGALVMLVSVPLGAWLIFASFGLTVFEQFSFERILNQTLDVWDSLIDARVQSQIAQHHTKSENSDGAISNPGETSACTPLPLELTAGIPTGMAPDIEKQVALLKAEEHARANSTEVTCGLELGLPESA